MENYDLNVPKRDLRKGVYGNGCIRSENDDLKVTNHELRSDEVGYNSVHTHVHVPTGCLTILEFTQKLQQKERGEVFSFVTINVSRIVLLPVLSCKFCSQQRPIRRFQSQEDSDLCPKCSFFYHSFSY